MDYDLRLEQLRTEALREAAERETVARESSEGGSSAKPGVRECWRLPALIAGGVGLIVLPFALLVRVAVSLYHGGATSPWLAVAGGVAATVVVATIYGAWLSRRLTGRARILLALKWVALPLTLTYAGYALLYLSSSNVKSPSVRAEFRSVHPVLRLALSTLILVDRSIVVTDMNRDPQEYRRMGLAPLERSLHRLQPDGWVHAVDLRSIGRRQFRTALAVSYFHLMGLRTLRHVGTADHLHVWLPMPSVAP